MDLCHFTRTPRNFDWSHSPNPTIWLSSKFIKPIFYPTLSIQWSNFKSVSGIRWTCVIVSTFHETSITKNIQYSSKRIIHFINITKNGENDLEYTAQNVQNDPNGFACDFWLPCFAIWKLETDKSMKIEKTLKRWPIPKTHLKPL